MLTFVHILESCNQDSVTVLDIIDDVLKQLKTAMPDDVNWCTLGKIMLDAPKVHPHYLQFSR